MTIQEKCEELQKQYTCFTVISKDSQTNKEGPLQDIAISVKDNLWVRGLQSCAAASILAPFTPLEDATAVARVRVAGAQIIGKTVMDEFGFGSHNHNLTAQFTPPKNPLDMKRTPGGSSGGAAVLTATAPFRHVAIAESTGGSIESPAACCGVIGYCPTYGLVSRYGLISYADSFDKVGLMGKTVSDVEQVLTIIAGHDPKDATSLTLKADWKKPDTFSVYYPKEVLELLSCEVKKNFLTFIEQLKAQGISVTETSLPITFTYGVATYYLLATAEASTNLARYCGLRYGQEIPSANENYNEYFEKIRNNFSTEAKRRILLGTFARMEGHRDEYYLKAAKARTLIIEEFTKVLAIAGSVLILPTLPNETPLLSEIEKMTPKELYEEDALVVGPNLAGVPHATIPITRSETLSQSITACTGHLKEGALLAFLKLAEETLHD